MTIALDVPRAMGLGLFALALGARVVLVALQRTERTDAEEKAQAPWRVLGFS